VSAFQIIALATLGVLYVIFCAYWWRGGRPMSDSRDRSHGDDRR